MRKLRTKFLVIIGVLTLAFSGSLLYQTWSSTRSRLEEFTVSQGELALEFDLAIREYVAESVRPEVKQHVGADDFVPETMSTSFVARSVFDKVRDNEFRMSNAKLTPTEVMDLSLNQVLMRSINTSITSIMPVLSVLVVGSFVMGAVTLQEFALALLIGLMVGTFSSLFVAAPIATWLRERSTQAETTSTRQYRLSEAVKQRDKAAGRGAAPVPTDTTIPPRPRKQRRR